MQLKLKLPLKFLLSAVEMIDDRNDQYWQPNYNGYWSVLVLIKIFESYLDLNLRPTDVERVLYHCDTQPLVVSLSRGWLTSSSNLDILVVVLSYELTWSAGWRYITVLQPLPAISDRLVLNLVTWQNGNFMSHVTR